MKAGDVVVAAATGAAIGAVVAAGLAFCGRLGVWLVPVGATVGCATTVAAWRWLGSKFGDTPDSVVRHVDEPFIGDLQSEPDRDRRVGRWTR